MALTVEKVMRGAALVSSLPTFPVFCLYLVMVLLARHWKKVSSPLNLRPVLIVYNFACSLMSLFCVYGFAVGLIHSGNSFMKAPSEKTTPIFYLYYLTKVIELLDTVFMILRHKQRQISFLHVYHHSSMVILGGLCYHHYPWVGMAPYLCLNSAVHVVLYAYYGLTALNPDNPPSWKKALTQFQIIQFFLDLIHALFGYLHHGYCIYGILYGLTMVFLFSNFYYKAYMRPSQKLKKHEDMNGNAAVKKNS